MSNPTPQKTSKVTVFFHNVCNMCGKENVFTHMMDEWLADGLSTETKAPCSECAEKIKHTIEAEELAMRAEENSRTCGIPDNFREWDSAKGNKDLANAILRESGKSLFISGRYGTCKTRAACANLLRRIKKGERGKYVRFETIVSQYRRSFSNGENAAGRYIDSILKADILLIDDVCNQEVTRIAGELLYEILDRVYAGDTLCRVWIASRADLKALGRKFKNADIGGAVISRIDRLIGDGKLANITAETQNKPSAAQ